MSVSGYNISLNKTCDLGLSTTTTTYTTGNNVIFRVSGTHGSGYISLRASADAFLSGKTFIVRNIQVQLLKHGTFTDAANITVSALNYSGQSGWQTLDSKKEYPYGTTVLLNQLPYDTFKTVAIFSTGNSIINSYDGGKTAKLSIGPTFKYDDNQATSSNTINFTFNAPKIKRTLTYLKDDGSKYRVVEQAYYTTTKIIDGYKKSNELDSDSGYYTVSFNTNGGKAVDSKNYAWSYKRNITYEFKSWGGYSPGSTYTFTSDKSLTAIFETYKEPKNWIYKTLGTLPTAYRKGYIKTSDWYYSDDTVASSSDEVKSSFTLKCKWEPQQYEISFNLNGGSLPDDLTGANIRDFTITKIYGKNVKSPNFTPKKFGYKFAGWSNQNGSLAKVKANSDIDDKYYNDINTEYTNINVILYAQWELNPNKLKFNYYIKNGSSYDLKCDDEEYNITQTEFKKYSPKNDMPGDYAFIGWCDVKPSNWSTNHGIYNVTTDAPKSELPVIINIKDIKSWGGDPEQYYGIWIKTGKYIKVDGLFKKVSSAFVKVDGEWKVIREIWTKVNGDWKHEI